MTLKEYTEYDNERKTIRQYDKSNTGRTVGKKNKEDGGDEKEGINDANDSEDVKDAESKMKLKCKE